MKSDEVQAYLIIGLAAVGVYVAYRAYKAGSGLAAAVGDTVGGAIDSVTGAVSGARDVVVGGARAAVNAVENAYGETRAWATGTTYYSPDALSGSMSRDEAIRYAEELDKLAEARESEAYRTMVFQENHSLLRRYPAGQTTDPTLPYIGYRVQ